MVFVDILLVVAAYLLGSIPSAVWIGKKYYGVDVREHGSRNAGATNTLRVLGRRAALPVFALDVLKGFVAVTLAHLAGYPHGSDQTFNLKIALVAAAVLGHIFPVFAGFRGGKGVATLAGAVLGVYPPAVLLCVATFLVVLMVSHYVSLSSMTAGVMFPVYIVAGFPRDLSAADPLRLRDRRAADLHAPEEYPAPGCRHRIENLSVETAAPQIKRRFLQVPFPNRTAPEFRA